MPNTSFAGLADGGWRDLAYEPFREGVEVHYLMRGSIYSPGVAILRYQTGARIPRHRHAGLETIVVLEGTQSDENGTYPAGSVVLNPEGSEHSVWTDNGCVVLIQWNRPVILLEPEPIS